MTVVLYTTLGCHLCEQARDMLLTVNPQVDIHAVDIAEDDTLIAEYGERIPVLRRDDRELAWPFGLLDVQGLLLE
ncbi:MAG: glutaredoxin family protein [Alcanivorax sp.]|nr:MAG: glutaredoxin family protein [Alcanivorax sp.]